MAAKVKWLRPALNDLKRTIDYIALESPVNAKKINTDIFARTDKLESFPRRGSRFGRFQPGREVRQLYVYSWRILYDVSDDEIRILRVIHMSQDLDSIEI